MSEVLDWSHGLKKRPVSKAVWPRSWSWWEEGKEVDFNRGDILCIDPKWTRRIARTGANYVVLNLLHISIHSMLRLLHQTRHQVFFPFPFLGKLGEREKIAWYRLVSKQYKERAYSVVGYHFCLSIHFFLLFLGDTRPRERHRTGFQALLVGYPRKYRKHGTWDHMFFVIILYPRIGCIHGNRANSEAASPRTFSYLEAWESESAVHGTEQNRARNCRR
jgi:hypothetical protein